MNHHNNKRTKCDNKRPDIKAAIRKRIMEDIHPHQVHVLDCFSGNERIMYRECYKDKCDTYIGIDKKNVNGSIRMNNINFLSVSNINKFNLFDLDAYGSPWEQFRKILAKKKSYSRERIAFAITDGSNRDMRRHRVAKHIAEILDINVHIPKIYNSHEEICITIMKRLAEKYGFRIVRLFIKAEKNRFRVKIFYIGLVLEKKIIFGLPEELGMKWKEKGAGVVLSLRALVLTR